MLLSLKGFEDESITKYVPPKEAAQQLGVHVRTLAIWEQEGKIQAIKTPSGQRRYDISSYTANAGAIRATVIYARVSSRAQQPDLNRQVAALSALYPDAEVISEIGGGLNFKRRKLQALLERVMQRAIRRIVVAHKDRLPDSVLITSDGFVSYTGARSWYSTRRHSVPNAKWLRTSLQSSTASVQGSTGSESTSLKCRKIQIYPSLELNRVWKQWSAACRYVYNQAIAYQKKNGRIGKLRLRDTIMQSDLPQWVKDAPCHIRQNAIFDAQLANNPGF